MNNYIHYGCGFTAPSAWQNFDASPTLRFERLPLLGKLFTKNAQRFPANVQYGDIVKGLRVADASCQGIYCSHILEHLSYEDAKTALRNTWRMLKPGGIFRCIVPDLRSAARHYMAIADTDPSAAVVFMDEVRLGIKHSYTGIGSRLVAFLGNSHHRWMWDRPSLSLALEECGFTQIRPCAFHDCEDPMFAQVEERSRFEHAVAIECRR
jgi:hypothetical protein